MFPGSFGGFEAKERGKVFIKCDGKMVHWGVMDAPHPPRGDDPDAPLPPPGKRPPFPPPPKGPMKLISVHGTWESGVSLHFCDVPVYLTMSVSNNDNGCVCVNTNPSGCVGTQAVMMTRPEHADGNLPMQPANANMEWMWTKVEASDVVNGNFTPVAEGRCDGMSFNVKKARPAHRPHEQLPAPPADDVDAMLADAEGAHIVAV